jgi:hypothetical protein
MLTKTKVDQVTVLKIMYLTYAKATKKFNWEVFENIRTLRMTYVDLMGVDVGVAYQVAFLYMR